MYTRFGARTLFVGRHSDIHAVSYTVTITCTVIYCDILYTGIWESHMHIYSDRLYNIQYETDTYIVILTGYHTHIHTGGQAGRQVGRHTYRHTHTYIHTYRLSHIQSYRQAY